jgi:hypothetical protein
MQRAAQGPWRQKRLVNSTVRAAVDGLLLLARRGHAAAPIADDLRRLALRPADDDARQVAVQGLLRLAQPPGDAALLALLAAPELDPAVQQAVIAPAVLQRGAVLAPRLAQRAVTEPSASAGAVDPGMYAAQILGRLAADHGQELLKELAQQAQPTASVAVAARVIEALALAPGPQASAALGRLLQHGDAAVRGRAAVALGESRDAGAAAALATAPAQDPDPQADHWLQWARQQQR